MRANMSKRSCTQAARHGWRIVSLPCLIVLLLSACGSLIPQRDDPTDTDVHCWPDPITPSSWTLIALADSQAIPSDRPEIFKHQTEWIAAQASKLNIKYVVHVGDITNDSSDEQWELAAGSFHLLDGSVSYALAMGNHDYPGNGHADSRDTSKFDHYFPPGNFLQMPGFRDMLEPSSASNSLHAFEANGQAWLILTLEFGPRDVVLEWVYSVLKASPTANAIIVTHAFLNLDGQRFNNIDRPGEDGNPHNFNDDGRLGSVNDAEEMWQKVLKDKPNVRLVLCGHMHGESRRSSYRDDAPPVHQILADYQTEENGGNGTLRVMTFYPDGTLRVRTYSPHLDKFRTDPESDFALVM
jgi:predicted MPP superfamily phosphohydrolase